MNQTLRSSRTSVKKGIDAEQGRRRRDDTRIQLRKNKREQGLQKRRATAASNKGEETIAQSQDSNNVVDKKLLPLPKRIQSIMETLQRQGITEEEVLEAVRGLRKILSVEKNVPVTEVIDSGALPILVTLLGAGIPDKIQFESAWALTNVASTDRTSSIVECGALPPLIELLLSSNADLREQSAWCLGNVAGDSAELRDLVLSHGAMEPLLQNIRNPASSSLLNNAVWTLSNFCRGKPHVDLNMVRPAISVLSTIVDKNNMRKDTIMDACWALSYLSDGPDVRIQAILDDGDNIAHNLVKLLGNENPNAITPILRTLGNIVTGNDVQTQTVLDAGVLSRIGSLLVDPKKNIRKEACWLLSNIAAGTQDQISYLMSCPQELGSVIEIARNEQWDVRKEAIWVIANISTGGRAEHIKAIVEFGAIEALCGVLTASDASVLIIVLEALEKILELGEKWHKNYIEFVDECDGLDHIENLQEHQNDQIYQKSIDIIERFFGVEEEVEDENLAPMASESGFTFGLPTTDKNSFSMEKQQQASPLQPFNFSS